MSQPTINNLNLHCPECHGINLRVVEVDGGYECLDCQSPEHESWFWFTEEELNQLDWDLERIGEARAS